MKHRTITIAFAAIFVSALAFADNPTDASLMPYDGDTTVVQQNVAQQNGAQQNKESHEPKRSRKKDKLVAAKAKSENLPEDDRQPEQSNPEYQPTDDNFAGNN